MSARDVTQVLIINLHASQNAGDAALLQMAIRTVQRAFPVAQITLAMNEPDLRAARSGRVRVISSFTALCRREGRWRLASIWLLFVSALATSFACRHRRLPDWLHGSLRELVEAYVQAEVVMSCPGNIFASTARVGWPFLLSAYTVGYALALGRPLYVLPQSIGPLRRGWERALVRRLYSPARLVFVREPVSLRLAQALELPLDNLRLAPDLAFGLPAGDPQAARQFLADLGVDLVRPKIGVSVLNRLIRPVGADVWAAYERAVARVLTRFIATHDAQVVFFPQVTGPGEREDDRLGAARVLAAMSSASNVFVVQEALSPEQLKALYGQMDLFLGTRMHSVIFAINMAVPAILIEYLSKTRGLAEMLDLEGWTIRLADVTEDRLWAKLAALWEQRETMRQALAVSMPRFVAETERVASTIAENFDAR
jgi:colanic acid/amylovoran biosynthesis protein